MWSILYMIKLSLRYSPLLVRVCGPEDHSHSPGLQRTVSLSGHGPSSTLSLHHSPLLVRVCGPSSTLSLHHLPLLVIVCGPGDHCHSPGLQRTVSQSGHGPSAPVPTRSTTTHYLYSFNMQYFKVFLSEYEVIC